MKKLLILPILLLAACSSDSQSSAPPSSSQSSTSDAAVSVDDMMFPQRKQMLASYRSSSEMCNSDSGNCMAWTGMALKCELGLAEMDKGNYNNPYRGSCLEAESFRESVTGIGLSTAPGAYSF